jgi:murein DD-endopeptidase MepM/ murein hydrolase activator NlpD
VNTSPTLNAVLKKYQADFHPVVPFIAGKDKLLAMDFTDANKDLHSETIGNTEAFSNYINNQLSKAGCRYGIGRYNEHRTIYNRSRIFDPTSKGEEPRRLHIGTDIWGAAGTPVFAFMGGRIHSFAFNDNDGDYGATLILLHQLEGVPFYSLYGHLSLQDVQSITTSQYVVRGQKIAHFGEPTENGNWPPHLHFQIIVELGIKEGDYPGVCKFSEREKYLKNCPDPDLILQMNQYITPQY